MKNRANYAEYACPFSHIEKECGHELKGPEGYEDTYGVWCACGFRGPVFILEPERLNLKRLSKPSGEAMTKPLNEMSVEELLYYARNEGEFKEYREVIDEVEAFLSVLAEFKRRNELLEKALTVMHDEKQDYMTRNNLGIASDQHDIKLARAALKANRGEV